MLITSTILNNLLEYNADTGLLFWRERTPDMCVDERICKSWNTRYAGKEAFTYVTSYGYRRGAIFDARYLAHRVIWCMVTGEWPTNEIDHIDHNGLNNRFENLRTADRYIQMRNTSKPSTNTSGIVGVYWDKPRQKWSAQIQINNKGYQLGRFDTKDEAIAARKAAEIKHGFHLNHGK